MGPQELQIGNRLLRIRRTATADEFRGHGCVQARAPLPGVRL